MAGTATGGIITEKDLAIEVERRVEAELKRLEKEATGFVITTPVAGTVQAELDGTFMMQIHKGPYQNPLTGDIVDFEGREVPMFNGRAYIRDENEAQWVADYYGYSVKRAEGKDALAIAMAVEGATGKLKGRVL